MRTITKAAILLLAMSAIAWAVPAPITAPAPAVKLSTLGLTPSTHIHVAVLGDSYVQQTSSGTDFTSPELNSASVNLVNTLSGKCWYYDPQLDNFGTGGGTSLTMMASLPALIARAPNIAFLQGGHNDFIDYGASYLPTLIANWESMIAQLRAVGITPVLILDPPINSIENSTVVTLAQLRQLDIEFNQWKRYYATDNGLLVWDWNTPLINLTDPAGSYNTGMSDDGIHPNWLGNMAVAERGLTDLKSIIGTPTTALITNQNDAYDPTYNTYGSLLTAPLFLTDYTGLAGGFTGTGPTSWTLSSSGDAGKTFTSSLVASSDGIGQWWQAAISGTPTTVNAMASNSTWLQQAFGTTLAAGTTIEGWVQFTVSSNSPFSAVFAKMISGANSSIGNWWGTNVAGWTTYSAGPTYTYTGTIYIPPMTLPAGFSNVVLYLQDTYLDPAGTFTGTIQWRRPTIRIVQNPY